MKLIWCSVWTVKSLSMVELLWAIQNFYLSPLIDWLGNIIMNFVGFGLVGLSNEQMFSADTFDTMYMMENCICSLK